MPMPSASSPQTGLFPMLSGQSSSIRLRGDVRSAISSVAITHDIPLSARLIEKGVIVIDDRGGRLTASDIKQRLSERSNNAIFREMGLFEGNQKRFDDRTIRLFAAAFDKAVSESIRRDS